ncbi:DUF483 domain-containing protein [Candidatus Woesearchaeota archaeon]|nr:DUF483 domain-containing protein [Candidatus Woesearchaeota archaeon]MBT5397200.1 DUF483 domain-containing protein [Candidatus Woesearchaeota archaeon]MBT6367254.1 DUF483 domain-containing protein [Candidatus Woesearchaeota archaeon]MBT7762600.1 DUF483 domain-containing protein [Candidatus Woesearchaeota archaeon]
MITTLISIFGSKTKAQEILLIQKNVKDVVRQGFYEQELLKVEQYCKKKNLFCIRSKFKIVLADDTGYSNKGFRVPEQDARQGMYFVYISRDEEKAWLAAYYELINNHTDLGLLLGYPECCVKFFSTQFNEHNSNPEHVPTNHFTNITKRDKDAVLISHFPCSSECEKSIELAKTYLAVLTKEDVQRAEELLEEIRVTQSQSQQDNGQNPLH